MVKEGRNGGSIFQIWDGSERTIGRLRNFITKKNSGIYLTYTLFGRGTNLGADKWQRSDALNDIMDVPYNLGNIGDVINYSIVIDPENNIQKFYENGKIIEDEENQSTCYINGNCLKQGIENDTRNILYYCIGRTSQNSPVQWFFGELEIYSLRLYNRSLTDEEVLGNYNTSVAYHDLLKNAISN